MPGQVRLQNSIDGGAFLRNWDDQLMCWGGGGGGSPRDTAGRRFSPRLKYCVFFSLRIH